jgi:hypothetical protein
MLATIEDDLSINNSRRQDFLAAGFFVDGR